MLIGVLIERKRREKNIGLRKMEKLTGINHGQLYVIEKSKNNNIQLNILKKVCDGLDLKVHELLKEMDI